MGGHPHMKKRIYRGVNVKKVDVERLADSVREKRMVFGLDVAKEAMVGSVAVDRDEVFLNVKWTRDLPFTLSKCHVLSEHPGETVLFTRFR